MDIVLQIYPSVGFHVGAKKSTADMFSFKSDGSMLMFRSGFSWERVNKGQGNPFQTHQVNRLSYFFSGVQQIHSINKVCESS